MVTFGILHVDVLGAVVGWKWITVGCLGVIVFWAVLMLFIPENFKQNFSINMLNPKNFTSTSRKFVGLLFCASL